MRLSKLLLCAKREYTATVLTKAFFLGAIVFPFVAWGAIIGVTASGIFNQEKEPLEGTIAIIDGTTDQTISKEVAIAMDPEARARAREELRRRLESGEGQFAIINMVPEEFRQIAIDTAMSRAGLDSDLSVTVRTLPPDTDTASLRERLLVPEESDDALVAFAVVGEPSLKLPPNQATAQSIAEEMLGRELTEAELAQMGYSQTEPVENPSPDQLLDGRIRVVHRQNLDPDYVSTIQYEFRKALERERYKRQGIEPNIVKQFENAPPIIDTSMVSATGEEEDSTAGVQRLIPIAFFMLLYVSVLTGGQYLFLGTLEEKSSRVMEVLLSAVSPLELLVGKLVGQGLVGLTVLTIYLSLGLLAADRFNVLSAIPMEALPGLLPYFLMAYLFFGALFVAVGSAVTEIREASALQAPLVFLIIVIIAILFPIMDNPDAPIARIMSFFPPATPFVMVMRLSQPAHVVPLWEIIATGIVGVLGVLFTIWLAAKIFRVGVLMYGKPPSFGTLLKWIRQS